MGISIWISIFFLFVCDGDGDVGDDGVDDNVDSDSFGFLQRDGYDYLWCSRISRVGSIIRGGFDY